jgi:hypothetical protein
MIGKPFIARFLAAAIVLGASLALASCGQFSGYVADRWPHWAGGMPDDVPPRPGAPGYDEFIAHGQAEQNAAKPDAPSQKTATTTVKPGAQPVLTAPVPPAASPPPADDQPAEDPSVVKGGLY